MTSPVSHDEAVASTSGGASAPTSGGASTPDALADVRDALEAADQLPVHDRVAVFERANEVLTAELTVLDEV